MPSTALTNVTLVDGKKIRLDFDDGSSVTRDVAHTSFSIKDKGQKDEGQVPYQRTLDATVMNLLGILAHDVHALKAKAGLLETEDNAIQLCHQIIDLRERGVAVPYAMVTNLRLALGFPLEEART